MILDKNVGHMMHFFFFSHDSNRSSFLFYIVFKCQIYFDILACVILRSFFPVHENFLSGIVKEI